MLAIAAATLIILLVATAFFLVHYPATQIPPYEPIDSYRYLDQGWGAARESPDRERYYYTPQGTSLRNLRYSWFVNLEAPWGSRRFAAPDHLRALGFIVDPVPTRSNPDQLPVGFARRYDETLKDDVLDITCAACHSGQLQVTQNGRVTAIRIDGGAAMHAFTSPRIGQMLPVLLGSMTSTYLNPFKFNRFARAVLGDAFYDEGKGRLRAEFGRVLGALLTQAWTDRRKGLYPTEEGFGRTDALGRILNNVFATQLDEANYRIANAPVSYPYLWNIWRFDWVQYMASVSQPMARNVGEAMGTGATMTLIDEYGRPLPATEQFRTSIQFENLHQIESTLRRLRPPRWPEDLLGAIDQAKAKRGETLFQQHCVFCHGPVAATEAVTRSIAPLFPADTPMWQIRIRDLTRIGTDPTSALNFINRRLDLSRAGISMAAVRELVGRELSTQQQRSRTLVAELTRQGARSRSAADQRLPQLQASLAAAETGQMSDAQVLQTLDAIDLRSVPVGRALNILGLMVREKYYDDQRLTEAERECFNGFGQVDLPQAAPGYKPRPLEGIWATPPYLHNGSVPNLYEMLSPAYERSKGFYVGRREYDPVKVGYTTEPLSRDGGFWLDTRQPGNANTGHEFRAGYVPFDPGSPQVQYGAIGPALSVDERFALIEYLKVHRDPVPDVPIQECRVGAELAS